MSTHTYSHVLRSFTHFEHFFHGFHCYVRKECIQCHSTFHDSFVVLINVDHT
jgi:cbb3-type cytochrome oxidase cytochrome c subunit